MPFDPQDFNLDELDIIEDTAIVPNNYYNTQDRDTSDWRIKTELGDGSEHWENCDRDLLNDRCLTLYDNGIDFDLYQFNETTDEWEFTESPAPYSLIEDLDDLPNPFPHGQLLPQLSGDVDEDLIFKLATTGDRDLLHKINHLEAREKASRILDNLHNVGAWDTTNDSFDDGNGGMNVGGVYLPAAEARELWEDGELCRKLDAEIAELLENDNNIFSDNLTI